MASQPEAKLSAKIVAALNKIPGCRAEKRHGTAMGVNTLDISGSIHGFAFEIETKMPGKEPTDRQYSRMRKLAVKNVITGWMTDVDGAVAVVMQGLDTQLKRCAAANRVPACGFTEEDLRAGEATGFLPGRLVEPANRTGGSS